MDSRKEFQNRDNLFLTIYRDEKSLAINDNFQKTFSYLEKSSGQLFQSILKDESTEKYIKDLDTLSELNSEVVEFFFFDKNRKPFSILPEESKYLRTVQDNLTDRIFSSTSTVDFLSFPDGISLICIYRKHLKNNKSIGYSATLLNLSFVNPALSVPDSYSLDIYNEEYQLIGTTSDKQLNVVTINDLTKIMVDGYSGIMEFNKKVYGYGNINLGETALYLAVNRSSDSYGKHSKSRRIPFIFFVVILLFSSFLVAWKLYKEILKYGESILINNTFTKDIRFFLRMRDNLSKLITNSKIVENINNDLKYMENDISYIIDKIPELKDENPKD